MSHLAPALQEDVVKLITKYKSLFPDVPGRTTAVHHDIDVGNSSPIKQHPYRVNPVKRHIFASEVDHMLTNGIIEPSFSSWSSPCLLVPKSDKSYRFVTDFRKVNTVTKTDSFPVPRVDECVDRVGHARYVTKLDLLKGYWQVPLTERAKDISAFVTPDGLYRYLVKTFGTKNSSASFQRLMNRVVAGLKDTEVYVDDLIIHSET